MSQHMLELWAGYSGSRMDSRVQVGSDFDPAYDGYKTQLGWIWAEEESNMVGLWSAYSCERTDTRTQNSAEFEPGHGYSDKKLLGYIYKEKQKGMSELFARWSDSRNDTNTQVGDNFSEDYKGHMYSVGYFLQELIYVESIDFLEWQTSVIPKWIIDQKATLDLDNAGSREITPIVNFIYDNKLKCTFEPNDSQRGKVRVQPFVTGIPIMDSNGNMIAVEQTVSLEGNDRMWQGLYSAAIPVGGEKKLRAELVVVEGTATMGYTVRLKRVKLTTRADNRRTEKEETQFSEGGKYTVFNTCRFQVNTAEITQTASVTNPSGTPFKRGELSPDLKGKYIGFDSNGLPSAVKTVTMDNRTASAQPLGPLNHKTPG